MCLDYVGKLWFDSTELQLSFFQLILKSQYETQNYVKKTTQLYNDIFKRLI